jgi:hypothetical protein
VSVRCVLPLRENEYCGSGGMGFKFVGGSDGMFHNPSHATLLVFGVSDVGLVPCEVCVTTARREECVFKIEGVACLGVEGLIQGVGV